MLEPDEARSFAGVSTPIFRKIRETRQKERGNDGHNGLIFHNFIKNRIETILKMYVIELEC